MRLLIIEDEADLRGALQKALAEEGYAVDTAADGAEGLSMALSWNYDAILLDLMLPVMDGWSVLEKLREKKTTPLLILTARDQVEDRVRGLDLGSDDFVVKPVEIAELCARLRALIRRAAGRTSSTIDLQGLQIDTAKRSVTFEGHPVTLTAREYGLLEYLAMHRGRVVSRTELYDHLFDENDDTLSNVLEVHVCNLRKKTSSSLIRTRRGHGYIMDG